jgi:serine/threonine protein kinase
MYLSPEALSLDVNYNEMTDIWSTGVCLYYMLAGYLPFVGRRMHTLAREVISFPMRFPAGLSADALNLLTGLLSRDVGTRLMIVGILRHPWCQLPEEEVRYLFNPVVSENDVEQPAYRNWEVKARKLIKDGNTTVFGPALEQSPPSLKRTGTWPVLCGEDSIFPTAAHVPQVVQQASASVSEEHYLSSLPVKHRRSRSWSRVPGSRSPHLVPGCYDWELRLRREHLNSLYGPSVCEPAYRNWEIKERRREILAMLD